MTVDTATPRTPSALADGLTRLKAVARPSPERRRALRDLLVAHMSAAQLQDWLSFHPGADHLRAHLPDPAGQSPMAYASDIVDLLERHGAVNDWFFRDLYSNRPAVLDKIREVALAWGCHPPEPAQWIQGPRRRTRARLGLALFGMAIAATCVTLSSTGVLVWRGLEEAEHIRAQFSAPAVAQAPDPTGPVSLSAMLAQANEGLLADLESHLEGGQGVIVVSVAGQMLGRGLHDLLEARVEDAPETVLHFRLEGDVDTPGRKYDLVPDLLVRGRNGEQLLQRDLPLREWNEFGKRLERAGTGALVISGLEEVQEDSANEILTGIGHSKEVRAAVVFTEPEGYRQYFERNPNQSALILRHAVSPLLRSPAAVEAAVRALARVDDPETVAAIRDRILALVEAWPHLGQALVQPHGVDCMVQLARNEGALHMSAIEVHQHLAACHLGGSRRMAGTSPDTAEWSAYRDVLRAAARETVRRSDAEGRFYLYAAQDIRAPSGATVDLRDLLERSDLVELDDADGLLMRARFSPRWLQGYLACEAASIEVRLALGADGHCVDDLWPLSAPLAFLRTR